MSKFPLRFTVRYSDGVEVRHFQEELAQETAQRAEERGEKFECIAEDTEKP